MRAIRTIRRYVPLALLLLAAALGGCEKKEERPEDALLAYVTAWDRQQFEGMYDRLTPEAQAAIAKEDFVGRYRTIYEGIEAKRLSVAADAPGPDAGKSADEVEIGYHVRMDTVAGPIEFDHRAKLRRTAVGKRTEWRIAWEPSLLFPGMAEGDKVRVQTTPGERGEIVDRNGVGLAVNGAASQIGIVPGKWAAEAETSKAKLAGLLGIAPEEIDRKLAAPWVKPDVFVPIAFVEEERMSDYLQIPGVDKRSKSVRAYPLGEAAAHLTGYIGEISAEELEKRKDGGYAAGERIGKSGLEQLYEDRLRGRSGVRVSIVDAGGKEKAVLAETEPAAGETVRLTVDANLQRIAYDELRKDAATAAAINPVSGDILALVSSPSYDPNAFARGLSDARYEEWNRDPRKQFLNRFSKGYSPGSAFKLVTAAIGLDAKTLDPGEAVPIQGLSWSKDRSWGGYYVKRVHEKSPVRLTDALTYSDNIYFAQAALRIGAPAFAQAAAKFGIGEELPIPYPFKKSQLSNDGIRNDIQLADTGYGQGEVIMTPLHIALVFSAVAGEGDMVYPALTREEGAPHPDVWKANAMSPETAALLRNDLIQAVASPAGPGHGAYVPGAAIAGKTGTAELKASKDADGQENGWFVGFDAADPKLLLAIMVEDVKGRGGSGYVTPKAKRIFQQANRQP
ncbi:penicillin-binding transpeptidase domain-containing protein [Paenibacillus flagellatus]|uniref:MecA protein n=1 Tax=Paenibacillus flagellatus TaxID=2211139 RepID=A0A2V5KG14_9BACL|nr:penicillin-binding transpeptidase domain-containing protein [Paenibacillus flagellatus]PYI57524.1 MecA protein [Paenibacillus flagellatus]